MFRNLATSAMGKKGDGCERNRQRKKKTPRQKRKHRARSSGAVLKPLEHDQALTSRMLNQAPLDLNLTFGKD